ncbi:MAG: hypothetical protein KAR19_13350 [Bacteroidales bacterium]|nr:hypothetical protein [Bacteroidales bacterium]
MNDVTLLGLSMGGWYCLRAAAFEPRVKRVIASGHSIDYMKSMPKMLYHMHMFFINRFRDFTNRIASKTIKKGKGKPCTKSLPDRKYRTCIKYDDKMD